MGKGVEIEAETVVVIEVGESGIEVMGGEGRQGRGNPWCVIGWYVKLGGFFVLRVRTIGGRRRKKRVPIQEPAMDVREGDGLVESVMESEEDMGAFSGLYGGGGDDLVLARWKQSRKDTGGDWVHSLAILEQRCSCWIEANLGVLLP